MQMGMTPLGKNQAHFCAVCHPCCISTCAACPAGVVVILIALAFPFFGVINSFLGAATTTLETYIIPALAYNWVYSRQAAQAACATAPFW